MNKSTSNKKNVVDNSTLDVKGNLHIGDVTYIINEKKVTIPHLLTNNIPSNGGRILGRDKELATIATHLAHNLPTVLVNGIGGIGKTSVAAKYVATFGHTYKHLAWLTVQSSLVEAFTNDIVLLKSLHIEQDVRQLIETQRLTDAFKLVVHQLNTLENTLVVLDNANDIADLMDNKNLFDTAKCHYLITSRTQPQEWTIVPIDVLSEDEAVALFRKIAPSAPDPRGEKVAADPEGENASLSPLGSGDVALKSLLSKLFYHTLLIELVAKAVENAGFSFQELQTMVETQFIHNEKLNEDIVPTGKHGDNYAAKRAKIEEYIWLIFKNVKDLGNDAKQILRGMALLPVATPFDRDFLKIHLALFEVKDIVPNLSLLVEWGWLEKEQNKWFKMHPLIGDVVVEHLKVDAVFAEKYMIYVAKLIYYDNSIPEHNLFRINENRPLAERLNSLFFDKNTEGVSELLNNLGNLEESFGFYKKSIDFKKRSLQIAEVIFDKNNEVIAIRQNNLGLGYQKLGYFNDADTLLNAALASDLKNFGESSHAVNVRQCNLAILYQNMGRFNESIRLAEIVLENTLKNHSKEELFISLVKNILGLTYINLEKYDLSIKFLEESLELNIKNLGENHPNVASIQANLSEPYRRIKQFDKAMSLSKTALEMSLKNFENKQHPDISKMQNILSNIYADVGKYDEAIALLKMSLASNLKNFGEGHLSIAICQSNLANVYKSMGKDAEAKSLWKEAYEICLKKMGAEYHHTILFKQRAEM